MLVTPGPPLSRKIGASGWDERARTWITGSAIRRDPLLRLGGRGGCGQARRNRASALPEAILKRAAGSGMASKNCPTAVASGRWNG